MELKEVILSTLAEMEDGAEAVEEKAEMQTMQEKEVVEPEVFEDRTKIDSELIYLNSIRERLLVLFEGFQSPNNANIEAKIDMTLNFLEYTLATIDSRVEKLEKRHLNEPV